jgi:hypothetical protein
MSMIALPAIARVSSSSGPGQQQSQQQQQQQQSQQQQLLRYLQAEMVVKAHCGAVGSMVEAVHAMSTIALAAITQQGAQ